MGPFAFRKPQQLSPQIPKRVHIPAVDQPPACVAHRGHRGRTRQAAVGGVVTTVFVTGFTASFATFFGSGGLLGIEAHVESTHDHTEAASGTAGFQRGTEYVKDNCPHTMRLLQTATKAYQAPASCPAFLAPSQIGVL